MSVAAPAREGAVSSGFQAREDERYFAGLRRREYAHLTGRGITYLDYTGAGVFAERQVRAHGRRMLNAVWGNPHSEHRPSRASASIVEEARERVLEFVDADPAEYTVCFTANASAACKLVGEAFPFGEGSRFVYAADNHNSVVGVRAFADRARATSEALPLDDELRLRPFALEPVRAPSLIGLPAQSNFSGVRHDLETVARARALGYRVLLDAAAFVPTSRLSLRHVPADFVALSFYKIFGYPTGLGALVARRESLAELRRPWFAGGTVEFVSVRHRVRRLLEGPEAFEDGTPNYLGLSALDAGFEVLDEVGTARLDRWVARLTTSLLRGLRGLRNAGGPAVRIYGPSGSDDRGCTVAFNLLDGRGRVLPYAPVERWLGERGVAIRGGCFCNPGASEAAFRPPEPAFLRCLERFQVEDFTPERMSACLDGVAVGALRASVGIASSDDDVTRLVAALGRYLEGRDRQHGSKGLRATRAGEGTMSGSHAGRRA